MYFKETFRKAAAAVSGFVIACSSAVITVNAEETTVPAETSTVSATETTVSETTVPVDTTTSSVEVSTETSTETAVENDGGQVEWYKAELDSYDDSLSLISYEASPESTKKDKKSKKTPTPVELNVTGGYVGDIPWLESEPVIDAKEGQFAIVTYGWGHGVGMSQNGANFYAMYSGWTYQDILFHYYPDTYLMNTGEAEDEKITVNGISGDVLSMVSQIVYNEVGGSMSYEAIKAQAVAVYTYCKYNGNDSSDLRCKPFPPQIVVDAVSEVLGQALYYDGYYALTMFSASSGGITANCGEVFYADPPYLRSVSSDYDASYDPHYGTVTYIDDFQLRNMIQAAYKISLSDNPENWLKPTYSDQTGYVTYINIDDKLTVRGYEFKLALGLKSSKFNVFYTPRPEGEKIPEGTSQIIVVDPDYIGTPAVWYPNNYPTDIGSDPATTEEPTEAPTEDEESSEEPTEDSEEATDIPPYTEPVSQEPTTEEDLFSEPDYTDEPVW
ncbi:MAG: sporulation protein [Ruminococcus sp.]|nr:sporulation protein [Ruminococcus sp.]